jgi:hypothetical protein
MSGEPRLNPYTPPPMDVAYAPSGRPSRPAWLVVICVIAIALGALGLVNGAWGVVALIFQDQLQTAFAPRAQPGLPPELQEAQEEFNQKLQDLQAEYAVPVGAFVAARIAVGSGLLVGGIWCLGGNPRGRQILIFALAAAIVFEVANGIFQVVIARHMLGLANGVFQKFADNMPNRGGPPPEMMLSFMRGVMWFGIILGLLWQLIKVGFYFGGVLYLRRQAIAGLFQPATISSQSST